MMMGGICGWILRSVLCFIVCLPIIVQSTSAQTGILNIACCAEQNYTDSSTSTIWIPDDSWFSDKTSCRDITGASTDNQGSERVRFFYIDSGKRCYNLSTTKDQDYLIRGTFPAGKSVPPWSSFNVSVGVTTVSQFDQTEEPLVEGIFGATDQHIDFCLVYVKGDPHISQLQLWPVNNSEYLQKQALNVLKLVHRVDVGNTGNDIRYPEDPYDRIWKVPDPETNSTAEVISSIISNDLPDTSVPLKVLQTALIHRDRLEFRHEDLDRQDNEYTVYLYFLELNADVKAGQRVFDIYTNNVRQLEKFDIVANGSVYRRVNLTVTANAHLNLTLVKVPNGSGLGPILSAYEVLQAIPRAQGTNQHDVFVMGKVRGELLQQNTGNEVLQSWSGDPCLPVAWKGLACEDINGSSVITELDISASKFQGPIPASITQLILLKKLNLSHNDFSGMIPQVWKSSNLISVDLSHNDLMGYLPDSLTSLPLLTTLLYGCNPHFSQEGPPSWNTSRLITTDSGECEEEGSTRKRQGIVIGTIAGGTILVTVAAGALITCTCRQKFKGRFEGKRRLMAKNPVFSLPSADDLVVKSINIQLYTLEYIEHATRKYKTLIGEGGFGSVYRGSLPDGQEVAVKVRSSTSTQGTREFENELNLLSAIRHENLVPLLGYCCENDQQILVYPFMSNGSLQDRLYGEAAKRKILDWPTRLSIALGAARGLTHLHTFAGRCVIHRDVKSSNILLDHSMNAKVADFGFSKYAPQEGDSGASLEVRGTAGYLDPEYYSTQHLSAKSDVFSFGVVLLEIVSGKEPLNIQRPRNEWSLVEWAKPYIRESKIDEIVDPNIKGGYHAEAMWRVVETALACIEPSSAYRPCMADIVRELEDALIIENNASEYMKSIDSLYSTGNGSNRFSIILDKKMSLPPPTPTPTEPSPINTQGIAPPEPR